MRIAAAQIRPVLLDRAATLERVVRSVHEAADAGCRLVAFGETFVPGYPVWPSRTDGARFEADDQKAFHARYVREAVDVEGGDLEPVQAAARERGVDVAVGVAERARDRGGASVFCSAVLVGADGEIRGVHRKLVPTYEERLSWAHGDGHGLRTHDVDGVRVGLLNCWESWMPLARAALQADGVEVLVLLWPGCVRLTREITRFAAYEGRCFVLSAGALIAAGDVAPDVEGRERIGAPDEVLYDGGSAAAGPDGAWLAEPVAGREALVVVDVDPEVIRRERLSFDPAGHYARPGILRLEVDRRRERGATFRDD